MNTVVVKKRLGTWEHAVGVIPARFVPAPP
jgi:hypothetical protein